MDRNQMVYVFNSKFLIDEILKMLHESDRGGSAIIQYSMFDVQKSCHCVIALIDKVHWSLYSVSHLNYIVIRNTH
jgi:hypothetical protein